MLLTAIHVLTEIPTEVVAYTGEQGWYTAARVGAFERSNACTSGALNTIKTQINQSFISIKFSYKIQCHINKNIYII